MANEKSMMSNRLHTYHIAGMEHLRSLLVAAALTLCGSTALAGVKVTGSVYGGGNQANVGETEVNVKAGEIVEAVYGGCNSEGTVSGNAVVTLTGGTVGTVPGEDEAIGDAVFGGGRGEPTLVNGNVTVYVGTLIESTYTGNATIHGNVYGGSALGNTNGSFVSDVFTPTENKNTKVYLYAGTINGSAFGGGLGRKAAAAVLYTAEDAEVIAGTKNVGDVKTEAVTAVESFVGGDVDVLLDGAKVQQVFGANNLNGTPMGRVLVHVKRTIGGSEKNSEKPREERSVSPYVYDVHAVYGGGNEADYVPTKATGTAAEQEEAFAEVLIEGCQATSIEYVYGGGNAAAVPATDVTVKGTYIINTLYGGGNGADPAKPGADLGIYKVGDTPTNYGTGKAVTKLLGGYINTVYGGSNTKGDVRGGTDVRTKKVDEVVTGDCCTELKVGDIYGAGSHADVKGDVNITLGCMPEDFVAAVYGGAEEAIIDGDVTLTVTSGKFGRVFGGNNKGGNIRGSINVIVNEHGCKPLIIGELYGGGNAAPYSIYGCTKNGETWSANTEGEDYTGGKDHAIEVEALAFTSIGKVFGGGMGSTAKVIGNTRVYVNVMKGYVDTDGDGVEEKQETIGVIGQVFGGGGYADVIGNTLLDIGTADCSEDIGVKIESRSYLKPDKDEYESLTAGIYGGGFSADVIGNTTLNIGTYNQTIEEKPSITIDGDIFGGGLGESTHVTGNVTVNIGTNESGTPVGYANITGDVYGGSAKGTVNSKDNTNVNKYTNAENAEEKCYTKVNFYGGTITGNLYGGGEGQRAAEAHEAVYYTQAECDAYNTEHSLKSGDDGYLTPSVVKTPAQAAVSAIAANVFGPVTVTMEKGSTTNTVVENVFGCNNFYGTPKDTVAVIINGGTVNHNVYGGGDEAEYTPTNSEINYPAVYVNNGTITENVFGGGLGTTATAKSNPHVTIGDKVEGHVVAIKKSVYGGGSLATVDGSTNIVVNGGTIGTPKEGETVYGGATYGNIYGGGFGSSENVRIGIVKKNTEVIVKGGNVLHSIYGGGAYGSVGTYNYASEDANAAITGRPEGAENTGKATIRIVGGTIGTDGHENGMIFGASRGDIAAPGAIQDNMAWVYDTDVIIGTEGQGEVVSTPSIRGSVYGSGENGHTYHDAKVTIYSGMVGIAEGSAITDDNGTEDTSDDITYSGAAYPYRGNVYGGGCGTDKYYSTGTETHDGHGDKYNKTAGIVGGDVTVTISGGHVVRNVYGAGAMGSVTGKATVNISGKSIIGADGSGGGYIYTAARGNEGMDDDCATVGSTELNISGGTVWGSAFGGGQLGTVKGSVAVTVSGGVVKNDVYGGGALANTNTENWKLGELTPTYINITDVLTENTSPVVGLYTEDNGVYTEITDPDAKAASGTTYYEKRMLPGTWAEGKNSTSNTTSVILTGGVIGNVYGGGLGDDDTPVYVFGDVKVIINKPADIEANGGRGAAFTQITEDVTVGGTTYTGVPLTGRIFGCNNIKGTPLGDVLVEVYSTRQLNANGEVVAGHKAYEIQAVYGGGNQADYSPAVGKETKVNIYGCDESSIARVYGGGNSALVPSTDVTIWGSYDIEYAFAGGNGGQPIKTSSGWVANGGAGVNGHARITCHGGKIGEIFGGSDYLGIVRKATTTQAQQGTCPLRITKLYGAGKEADVDGDVNVIISGCTKENSEIEYVCGGSYKANISGSIHLTITAGYFQNVYGGNDQRGSIGGDIIVDIEETDDCKPIIINNLVGGGNQANFPGKDKNGVELPDRNPYRTITVNVKSATYIGNVYGGSFMAETKANTFVNVNMIQGNHAGKNRVLPANFGMEGANIPENIKNVTISYAEVSPTPSEGTSVVGYYTKSGDNYIPASTSDGESTYYEKLVTGDIDEAIGTIGSVYGGGKQGQVIGDAQVNIGSLTEIPIMKRNASGVIVDTSDQSIYDGEGKQRSDAVIAYVNKPVKGAHIIGDVFGGGEKAEVTGSTEVFICASRTGDTTYDSVAEGAEGVSIGGSIYGGGSDADVKKNTRVTMAGGYVFDGVYGGGLHGSVGTFTRDLPEGHPTHPGCVGGKPETWTNGTGKCTVIISGGQIGPVEAALVDGGMKNTHRYFKETGDPDGPVDVGFVFGAGRGEVENPDDDPDADFHTYVKETEVIIKNQYAAGYEGGVADSLLHVDTSPIIMASVYGGGENGRVRGNTLVKIYGGQIGCGEGKTQTVGGKLLPLPYTEAQWTSANASDFTECASWDYGKVYTGDTKKKYLPYDPLANLPYRDGSAVTNGSTTGSDGHTYYGYVFGGGSGYFPYEIKNAGGTVIAHDWLESAGVVEGSTKILISGGHILTDVFGGNELTSVMGDCVVIMTGGTLGVPRTDENALKRPVTCYLFGGGKGDLRSHFAKWTNVKNTRVSVGGSARIFGSVFGGAEDGHVLGNTNVQIDNGTIGTTGTSYVDGNVFGGGRGYSGEGLLAGSVGGNVTMTISGGAMLGSVYGGGRLASVGIDLDHEPGSDSYGQLKDETGTGGAPTYGHVTINITGGTIGTTTADDNDPHPVGGNVFGGSMGRITLLNGDLNPLWPKQAVVKLTEVNISGGTIYNNVYGGSEYGIVRNQATVNVQANATPANNPVIYGNVFGGGYGSDDQTPTTITAGGYGSIPTIHYTFTPMQWTGCVSGNTYVNVSGGKVEKNVYGGGDMASVGLINYNSSADGKTYNYIKKHDSHDTDGKTFYDFGLSWPYKFEYIAAAPNDPEAIGGVKVGGKSTVKITGTADVVGYVYGAGKGKVWFGETKDTEQDITEQRYTEAFMSNVKETEVIIGSSDVDDNPKVRTVYGGGEDGHVYENAKVTIYHGTITHTVFGGGKGTSTYEATLLDPTKDTPTAKGSPEAVYSWTAGKVYGNTNVTMNGGSVGWFIYGGGNMASVGKGNYTGGSDDYSTAGYGELPSAGGAIWTASQGFDPDAPITESNKPTTMADYFLSSGKTTVTIMGGNVGPTSGTGADADGIPYGSVFGGSRGKAAKTIAKSPRYKYGPDFFLGYVNKANINIGGYIENSTTTLATDDGPRIYGSIYGGGQDGHVRNSTEVRIFKGNVSGQGDYRSGNVFGAGSGVGKYADGVNSYCNNASGSVTCSTLVEVSGGTIASSVYGGGALASVGPPKIPPTRPDNEQKAASEGHKSSSCNIVNIKGGTITGSVYGASRGPGDAMFTNGSFSGVSTETDASADKYNPTTYATSIWTEVNITGGTINNNVYGGGEMGLVKESTVVNLTGGTIANDAYGGGKGTTGTYAIEANVGGNTTVKLNEGVAEDEKGCIVDKVYGCNDLNGTPKGHVTVHVYATQNSNTDNIYTKSPDYHPNQKDNEENKAYLSRIITDAKNVGIAAADDAITAAEALKTSLASIAEADLTPEQLSDIKAKTSSIITKMEALHQYDVTAVYGGGDLAKYDPTKDDENTEVIIEGCDVTSIKQVYGGGNAAPVPATNVTVTSCYLIDELFGGGNGKDNYKNESDDKWYINPGADVGYNTYEHYVKPGETGYNVATHGSGTEADPYKAIRDEGTDDLIVGPEVAKANRRANYSYGTGRAHTTITGGRIHNVYGGSNQKGNVRMEAFTKLQQAGVCYMAIGETYPGGKNADTDGETNATADCVDEGGKIFGGAKSANVNNNVHIRITNGHYDGVYGGNNKAGTINGNITITIEESGCSPIIIDELCAGGYLAPYSVYGYENTAEPAVDKKGNPIYDDDGETQLMQRKPLKKGDTGALTTPYRDPQINIISATRIDKIYGGGYQADLIGSPHINVNMTTGRILKSYEDHDPSYASYDKYPDGDLKIPLGTIGSIYGGGYLGDVIGDTYVEIGTGEWLNDNGQRETTDADGKVYTYNTTTTKWNWTQKVGDTTESGTVDVKPAPARNAATITGNVFGGGEGEALESGTDAFYCKAAMVGIDGEGEDPTKRAGGTSVVIANGTVGTLDGGNLVEGTGNVYGGGEIGRVEKNTVVTIGETLVDGATDYNAKFTPTIYGSVFGAGKGVETHGYSALVRGNSTVTIQGFAKVGESVYGGGDKASVGRYTVVDGVPTSLKDPTSGNCFVTVRDNAEIGPNNMTMFHVDNEGKIVADDEPDNSGHVFGAGKGAMPGVYTYSDTSYPYHMTLNSNKESVWERINTEEAYLKFIETLGLATQTEVTIGGNAFVKGDVFGGAEQGFVQHDTHVTIQDNCQIGNGYAQMADDGTYLNKLTTPVNHIAINRRYSEAEWKAGHLITVDSDPAALKTLADTYYKSSLPECASWLYGQATGTDKYAFHDKFYGTSGYDSKGGRKIADNGSTFYGNVFGGGSGYFPYAPGKWHWKAGDVGGNIVVDIKGGHILTNVYGGNELSNVGRDDDATTGNTTGKCTVNMSGGTIGVPRTLGQITAHPVSCYLFGGGKGDARVLFNKQTNVKDVEVNINGGWIYGSAFGGGEDGHVLRNVALNISGNEVDKTKSYADAYADLYAGNATKIGTWGTSYVDGNIFGGGRGFSGDAYTAGNVSGSVTMKIEGGEILGSVYGGGRLGSVGYGLYDAGVAGYGEMRDDEKDDAGNTVADFMRGHINVTISGGTIGNDYESVIPNTDDNVAAGISGEGKTDIANWDATDWTKWKKYKNIPYTEFEYDSDREIYRISHTKGGNVFAGGMGRLYQLDGTTAISDVDWWRLGNVKSTKLTITGGTIKSNVYGGCELGMVQGTHTSADSKTVSTEIAISGGTIGREITKKVDDADVTQYTFGSVFGGGYGSIVEKLDHTGSTNPTYTSVSPSGYYYTYPKYISGRVKGSTEVTMTGGAVKASVYGGGEMAAVGESKVLATSTDPVVLGETLTGPLVEEKTTARDGHTYVTVSGGTIGINKVGGKQFGGATMGNVYGGGSGYINTVRSGQIYGNTNVSISGTPTIYHNVYGGGAYGTVGDFTYTMTDDTGTGTKKVTGIIGLHNERTGTGTANVTITGGTIGFDGHENGMVFGSSRGDVDEPGKRPDFLAWVNNANVTIGDANDGTNAGGNGKNLTSQLIKGSVYGSGENGHTYNNTLVDIHSGTIGDPAEFYANRGNVYGAGCGTDTYTKEDEQLYNPLAGIVRGNTEVNIDGGHIVRSVYGGGAMASVGVITGKTKHESESTSFALSWPYEFVFTTGTGKATVNVTGGHIGTGQFDGGDVYGSSRGEAGDRYEMADLAYTYETEVNINYPSTIDMTSETAIQNDFTTQCITGSVHGSGENGYVYGNTKVTLNKGLIGHSLYGAGKGNGTYTKALNKIGSSGTYDAQIYSLIAGKVMGNTYVTMNGGRVGRNVYGGGNMGSVGKGNYAGGTDDYVNDCTIGAAQGYGEKIDEALWTSSYNPNVAISESNKPDNAYYFLSSGKATVNVISGIVGYIDATNPEESMKGQLPYGNVIGGSAGEAAPNVADNPTNLYLYSPAFFSGYVNETDVTIGGYKCKTAYDTYKVGDYITAEQYNGLSSNQENWEIVGPTIYASVYGGGQDGHVRRDTKVTVLDGEIGVPYESTSDPRTALLKTYGLDDSQWLHRGNIYGGGSGITKYKFDLDGDGKTNTNDGSLSYNGKPFKEEDYSTSSGSVTRFTEVNVLGGTIHRNVYGGGSNGSIGAPDMGQTYLPYKPGQADIEGKPANGPGRQSINTVNIGGGATVVTIGTPFDTTKGWTYNKTYGGEVYGACRGMSELDSNQYANSIWTQVNIFDKATIMGNVYGGGDNGIVKKDSEVRIGDTKTP